MIAPTGTVARPTAAEPDPTPVAVYAARRDRFAAERDALTARWNRLANLRLVAFLLAAAGIGWGIARGEPPLTAAGGALLVGFLVLARRHRVVGQARQRAVVLAETNQEAIHRWRRDWHLLPLRHAIRADPGDAYAADLDVFGHASLMHLLEGDQTPIGAATLAGWLLAPADPATIRARQVAVAELAPRLDLRDELALRVRLMDDPKPDPEPFLRWAEGSRWLARQPWVRWGAVATTALLWGLIAAQIFGLTDRPWWVVVFGFHVLAGRLLSRAYRILASVAVRGGAFVHYGDALGVLAGASFEAPALRAIQGRLTVAGRPAADQMRRLGRITQLVIPAEAWAHELVQALGLWDIHVLAALERWQAEVGPAARGWLEGLGEAEALAALAGPRHDEPAWALPTIAPEVESYAAVALGHPLLPAADRVANDVAVGPAGTVLLVTGSNMSGKSTLLRAIGVNAVLANAGGPVCAASLRLPPVALWTSVRLQDSLEHGVSYFMAELRRLKQIVDAANAAQRGGERRLLYLLDEILTGTNTAERQVAAVRVVGHLVASGALGAVSTHDLALADADRLRASLRLVHFAEVFARGPDGPSMTFDYTLRPGLATSTNALKLMELVGLSFDE